MIQEHLLIIVCLDSIRTDRALQLEEKVRIESKNDRVRVMPAFTGEVPESSPFGNALVIGGGKVFSGLPAPFESAEVLSDPADVTAHLKRQVRCCNHRSRLPQHRLLHRPGPLL